MALIINFLLLIPGFALYFYKARYAPIYYMLWCSLFMFFVDLVLPIRSFDDSYFFEKMALVYIWLCAVIHVFRKMKFYMKYDKKMFIIAILTIFYIIFLGVSRGTLIPFTGLMRIYLAFIPLWLIIRTEKIDYAFFRKYLFIALTIEIVLASAQDFLGMGYCSFVDRIAENGAENITGTFRRYNTFSENVSLLILSLLTLTFIREKPKYLTVFVLCLIGYYFVFKAGARTEFLALTLCIFVTIYARFSSQIKKIVLWGAPLVLIGYIIGGGIKIKSVEQVNQIENNTDRQMQTLNAFSNDDYLSEKSTLALSVILLNEYANASFSEKIFGLGRLYKSKQGYLGIICVDGAMADSDLALFLCETGLIGIILFILMLYYIVRNCKKKIYALSLLGFLVMVAVTDYGIFEGIGAIYLLLTIKSINNFVEEKETAGSRLPLPGNLKPIQSQSIV